MLFWGTVFVIPSVDQCSFGALFWRYHSEALVKHLLISAHTEHCVFERPSFGTKNEVKMVIKDR